MMLKITNIGGLLSLWYLWYHFGHWSISINESNIISPFFCKIFMNIPYILIHSLVIIMSFLFIRSIFTNKGSFILYFFSLFLYNIMIKISVNALMLETENTFFLFKLENIIPLELKLYHLEQSLVDAIMSVDPEILSNKIYLDQLREVINTNLDFEKIKSMNAYEIREYSYELLTERRNIDFREKKLILDQIMDIPAFLCVFYVVYNVLKNLGIFAQP